MAAKQNPTNAELTPYDTVKAHYNERTSALVVQNKVLKGTVLGMIAICCVLATGFVAISLQNKVHPVIVEIDKADNIRQGEMLTGDEAVYSRGIQSVLRMVVRKLRVIVPDAAVISGNLTEAGPYLDPKVRTSVLDEWGGANSPTNPFRIASTGEAVEVEITSVMQATKGTWQVTWTEKHKTANGIVDQISDWQALTGVMIAPPTNTELSTGGKAGNPLGIYINTLSWSRVSHKYVTRNGASK